MLAHWRGNVVGQMHNYGITHKQLADQLGVTREYVSMVLNGHRNPADAEERFNAAIVELVKKQQEKQDG